MTLYNKRFIQPGIGDSYIILLKTLKTEEYYHLYCALDPIYYAQAISEVFSLSDKIKLEFVEKPILEIPELTSDSHDAPMEFFPQFNLKNNFYINHNYYILQAHAGKLNERNCKKLSKESIYSIIEKNNDATCVLVGNNTEYKDIRKCINLIGETSIKDLICLAQNCDYFIGPEGFLSFVCLSQRKFSTIFYTSHDAVKRRILSTPWEPYSDLRFINI